MIFLNESSHTVKQLEHARFIPSQFNTHTYSKSFLKKKKVQNDTMHRVTSWNPSKDKTALTQTGIEAPLVLNICLQPSSLSNAMIST